jgi:hypothetical protein
MALQFNAATLSQGDQFKGYNSQASASDSSAIDHSLPMSGIFEARPGPPAQAGHAVPVGTYPYAVGSYAPGERQAVGVASGVYYAVTEGSRLDSVYYPYVGFTGHTHLDASGVEHTTAANPSINRITEGWAGS